MKKSLAILLSLMLTSAMAPMAYASEPNSNASAPIRINPIQGISPDFIKGADVSMLKQIEISGGKFYDQGVEKEALHILKDHGVNWVRLRIWTHPLDSDGKPLGGGNNDKAKTIEIAKRAHDLGLKVLLDFHYSDFWADPEKQNKPSAWAGLNATQLQDALYDYTADVIKGLTAVGAMPEMVQIGNETNTGMVWPDGKTTGSGGFEGWANLVKKGVQAVRDHDPNQNDPAKRTKIMIHLADGGNNELYRRNFDQLKARNVDYDVIGFSYYPYWHGPLEQLQQNMTDISKRYNKEVLVAENAYAYTLNDGDNFSNNFGPSQEKLGGYKATVQGQAQEVRDVMNAVAQVPEKKGLGIFYWEPDWIPVKGAEWSSKPGEGNGWENQAMFDFSGNALPSLDVFNRVSAGNGEIFTATATQIHPEQVNVTVGGALLLPSKVKVEFSDDSVRELPVTWEALDADALNHPGTISLKGSVAGVSLQADLKVIVQGATNLVKNPGFESGESSNWTITGDETAVKVVTDQANAHASSHALHYSLPQAMPFTASQTITGLANGTYTLKVWSHGGGGEKSLKLFANNFGGEEVTADIHNTKWLEWKHPIVMNIQVTNNQATIGVKADGNAGNWGNIDDFEFYTDRTAETLTAPSRVTKGNSFIVNVGNGGLVDTIYAEDITLHYDADKFEYITAQSGAESTLLLHTDHAIPGTVRFVLAHTGGKTLNTNPLALTFKAKTTTAATGGAITIHDVEWGSAPAGASIKPAILGSATVAITEEESGNDNPSSTGTNVNQGPAAPVEAIKTEPDGSSSLVQQPVLDQSKTALAAVTTEMWKQMLDHAKTDNEGKKKITLEISIIEGASSYAQQLPKTALQSSKADQQLDIVTPKGTVSMPSNMLSSTILIAAEGISLHIGSVDPATLPEALKAKIGDRPLIDLHLKSGSEIVSWNNPAAPVTIKIPYTPTKEELQHPDHLVVWYLDASGEAIAVPNAKYDAVTQTIVFTTTHFSTYAVAFETKSFKDITKYEWAKEAIEALVSKGVITGTSQDTFSPEQQVSRADYVVMLVKALGLSAKVESNFTDVQSSDYYYEALGIAKALGISEGSGNNRFEPKASITREDLMVLTARALHILKKLEVTTDLSSLNVFKDSSLISDYAAPSVSALVKNGIVSGSDEGIAPQSNTIRAEAALIIYRLLHLSYKGGSSR